MRADEFYREAGELHRQSIWQGVALVVSSAVVGAWIHAGMPLRYESFISNGAATKTSLANSDHDKTDLRTVAYSEWKESEAVYAECDADFAKSANKLQKVEREWKVAATLVKETEDALQAAATELRMIRLRLPRISREIEWQSSSLLEWSTELPDLSKEKLAYQDWPNFLEQAERSLKESTREDMYRQRMARFGSVELKGARVDYGYQTITAARRAITEVPRRWETRKAELEARRSYVLERHAVIRRAWQQAEDELDRLRSEYEQFVTRQQELDATRPRRELAARRAAKQESDATDNLRTTRDSHEHAEAKERSTRLAVSRAKAHLDAITEAKSQSNVTVRTASF